MGKKKKSKDKVPVVPYCWDLEHLDFILTKYEVDNLSKIIIEKSRQGHTLSMILYDLRIRESDWLPFMHKHKKIKKAIRDATAYRKAWAEMELSKLARSPSKEHSPKLVELMYRNFFDIHDDYVPPDDTQKNKNKGYRVVLKFEK